MPQAPKDVLNSLIKLGVAQSHALVNEVDSILNLSGIFGALVNVGSVVPPVVTLLSLWNDDGSANSIEPTYPPANTERTISVNNGGANEILYTVPAGCVRRKGERPIYNLLAKKNIHSERIGDRSLGWNRSTTGWDITYRDATTSDPSGLTTIASMANIGGGWLNTTLLSNAKVGDVVVASFWVRRIGTEVTNLDLRSQLTGTVTSIFYPDSANNAVTGVWKRFKHTGVVNVAGNISGGLFVQNNCEYEIGGYQLEVLTGLANQNPSEYVSSGVLSAPFHGVNIDGFKWSAYENGNIFDVDSVVTDSQGTLIAASQRLGVFMEGATNQFISVTESMTVAEAPSLNAGTYTCWIEGAGSIVLSGGAIGTVTEGNPITFTLSSAQTVTHTPSGDVDRANTTDAPVATSFTTLTSRAADNGISILLADFGFPGATSGAMEFDITFNHDLTDLPPGHRSIASVRGGSGSDILYVHSASKKIATYEIPNSMSSSTTLAKGVTYPVKIYWEFGGNFNLSVSGVKGTPKAWDDWSAATLLEFLKGYGYGAHLKNVKVYNDPKGGEDFL